MNTERDNGGNMVPSLRVKSNAGDNADVLLWADPSTHRLLVNASVTVEGLTAVDDSAFTAGVGTGSPMMGFATSDSVDSGDVGVVGMTTGRALFVYIKGTDVGAAGGTSMTDDAAFTPGTTAITPIGAFFDDVAPDSVNEGDGGVVRMSANRNLYVTLRDAAGNERGLNIDASGQLAVTLASGQTLGTVTTVGTVTAVTTVSTVTAVTTVSTVSALGVGTTGPQKAEDVAFANGDMGLAVWTVRQDTLATTAANGDYVPFSSDSIGALYTRDTATLVDDAAFTPATSRVMPIGCLVDDTGSDSVDEGDIGAPRMSADRIQYVQGALAHDAVDAGNPLKVGGQARTTNPTAVADADRTNFIADKLGKQVVVGSIRDLKTTQVTTITASTSETTVLTAVASTFLDVYGVIVANSSATATEVTFKDATAGTTRFTIAVPAGETRGFMLPESGAHNQASTNNNWTATCADSVTSIFVTMFAVKNI